MPCAESDSRLQSIPTDVAGIEVVTTAADLRGHVAGWRRHGERIAFVPTMGNLHAGHYALVTQARRVATRVVASVFVNPTQFGPNEDYARYPRTLEADRAGLAAHGCDLLFAPGVSEMYPHGAADSLRIEVPRLAEVLEGRVRPGHFGGVATVVAKLFNRVQPDVALFGRKDYQQLLVIQRLVRELDFPIEVIGVDTVREANGLALSSRNQYLSPQQREQAALIHRTLRAMADAVRAGRPMAEIEHQAVHDLAAGGFEPDYAVVRRALDLAAPTDGGDLALIALVAARLGSTRLIDNVLI